MYKLAEKKVGSDLEARNAFIEEMIGQHPDDYTDGPAIALWDSYQAFAETVPTTQAGLLAMLTYADEVADREREALNDVEIFSTFATAAKALLGGRS